MKSLKHLLLLGLIISIFGFTGYPQASKKSKEKKIKQPKVELPETWSTQTNESFIVEATQLKQWWKLFQDSRLDTLIDTAVDSNVDLKIAEARVNEVRAMQRIAKADRYPTVEQNSLIAGRRTVVQTPISRGAVRTGVFQVGFDANWELDFFGGVRNSVKAAAADVQVAEESRRGVLVTLTAEVARNYMALRGLQRQLEVTHGNIDVQRDTRDLTVIRAKAGLASDLDVARAETQLALTESVVPELETSVANTVHRLSVLLGKEPGALLGELQQAEPIPTTPQEIPVGLPSELLRRRPDLRRAEAEIAAETARLGMAKSELYPKFQLTGQIGRTATSLAGLLLGLGNFFSIGPSISMPIFNAGRIRSNIKAQDERLDQAVLQYENTLKLSLEEVENSMKSFEDERKQRVQLEKAVASGRRAVDLSWELYKAGLSDFLSVLEAQNALYDSENRLAASDAELAVKLVAIYKALGGGW